MVGDENEILTNEMNSFLRSHRILNVTKQPVTNNYMDVWTFCIEYIEGSKPQNSGNHSASTQKIDYMEILSEEEFARFRILRECRKPLAREMGIPAYAILVDSQLAELSKSDIHTLSADKLKSLEGFGEKKLEKFGTKLLDSVNKMLSEKA